MVHRKYIPDVGDLIEVYHLDACLYANKEDTTTVVSTLPTTDRIGMVLDGAEELQNILYYTGGINYTRIKILLSSGLVGWVLACNIQPLKNT